jgi:hypothetical protein
MQLCCDNALTTIPKLGGDVLVLSSTTDLEITDCMQGHSGHERARRARALRRTECAQVLKPLDDAHPAGNDNQQLRTTSLCTLP